MAGLGSSPCSLDGPIGILYPGEMGAAFGSVLVQAGYRVLWASSGRSSASAQRASTARLEDVGSIREIARESAVILSICPPAYACEVAEAVAGFHGVYVDANAISPRTSTRVADVIEAGGGSYVDGSIIGRPADKSGPNAPVPVGRPCPGGVKPLCRQHRFCRRAGGTSRGRFGIEDGLRGLEQGANSTAAGG
jgi:hypothetical protein